ncbi:hypothetical protein FPV67DRAFT_1450167 [Lyophyllum atratum]|nr:hypothetical protein FPV67DRAFT_1450167 [Lyophyllum atratum]
MPIDLIAVIIAIVALLGSIANASLIVWEKRHTERRRRYHALADVVAKYRDPLHLAAEDLAMKISNIINNDFAGWVSESSSRARQDYAIMHTSFVLGRLFCWLYILRRDTQFLLPSRRYDEESGAVRTVLNNIRMTLRTTRDDSLFKVLTGEQEAIGELMTVVDEAYIFAAEGQGNDGGGRRHGGQCRCIGYASFVQRWKQDSEFREWFGSVVNGLRGMNSLSRGVQAGVSLPRRQYPPEERLRRLQHQLVDLIERLDPRGLHREGCESAE